MGGLNWQMKQYIKQVHMLLDSPAGVYGAANLHNNMPATHLGWEKAGKGDPTVKGNCWLSRHSNVSTKYGLKGAQISGLALL